MTRKLKVAVVGLGIGKAHLDGYAAIPALYEVAALCDLDAAKLAEAARTHGVARTTTSFDDVMAMRDLDVIDICTPPQTHRALVETALRAGFNVMCEKPLTGSLADADAIAAVAREAKGKLSPIFQYRFGNGLQKLKLLHDKGLTGKPFLTTIETSWRRDSDYYEVKWRGKWDTELGGGCLSQAIHAHDVLTYINGPVKSVYARLATRVNPIEVEDCAAIAIEMANGSLATLAVTLGAAEELSRIRFMFQNLTVESRSAHPYRIGDEPWHFKGKTAEIDRDIAAAFAAFKPAEESFAGQFARLHAALTAGAPLPVTFDDARASLELITAIYHSAETGSAVTMPVGASHAKYAGWVPAGRRWPTG